MSGHATLASLAIGVLLSAAVSSRAPHNQSNPEENNVPGSEACAPCHREIFDRYSKTVMATASGLAGNGLVAGQFEHKTPRVKYRVFQRDSKVWMSYERDGDSSLHGERQLLYFIGSGVKGVAICLPMTAICSSI